MPVGVPPLTPGTNKKLAEVLKGSFEPWKKEAQSRNITKGEAIMIFQPQAAHRQCGVRHQMCSMLCINAKRRFFFFWF